MYELFKTDLHRMRTYNFKLVKELSKSGLKIVNVWLPLNVATFDYETAVCVNNMYSVQPH
jgi:hypothetical protein